MDHTQAVNMHNFHMVGVQNMDRFSLRGCFLVIGAFGVVTLISYFNELAKAGLLSGNPKFKSAFSAKNGQPRLALEDSTQNDQVLLKHDGGLHQLDLNLLPFQHERKTPDKNDTDKGEKEDKEIQIALHLGKDDEYQRTNKSSTSIYQYHNVLPNFYVSLNASLLQLLTDIQNVPDRSRKMVHNFTKSVLQGRLKSYRNRTRVMIYQHDPEGYALRDCLLALSMEKSLVLPSAPLNAMYRKSWEMTNREQKTKYNILYGGLSFGVCESMSKECSYAAVISHPLDRLLQVYESCTRNSSITMCRFLDMANVTSVHGFLEHHGSSFFQKLLYYSRHCRLVGQDEVCIHDTNVYFVLSHEEKQEYLKYILDNIEQWFSVIGLVEELPRTLHLMNTVLGLNFKQCLGSNLNAPARFFDTFSTFHRFEHVGVDTLQTVNVDGVPYYDIREQLLRDEKVAGWLAADMAIYEKFVEIFKKQIGIQKELKKLMQKYYITKSSKTTRDVDSSTLQDPAEIMEINYQNLPSTHGKYPRKIQPPKGLHHEVQRVKHDFDTNFLPVHRRERNKHSMEHKKNERGHATYL